MLRFLAVLLLSILAMTIFVVALRTGRVQASFDESNVRLRKVDAFSYWFFTIGWGVLGVLGTAGSVALLYFGTTSTGPFLSRSFLAVTGNEWPLGVMAAACFYLLVSKLRTAIYGKRSNGA